MIFETVAAGGCRSYLIGCEETCSAAVIDPELSKIDRYIALASKDGYAASWGATNRLVVGPFKNLDRAKAVEADLKKAGSDAFVWRSDAGEELEALGGN